MSGVLPLVVPMKKAGGPIHRPSWSGKKGLSAAQTRKPRATNWASSRGSSPNSTSTLSRAAMNRARPRAQEVPWTRALRRAEAFQQVGPPLRLPVEQVRAQLRNDIVTLILAQRGQTLAHLFQILLGLFRQRHIELLNSWQSGRRRPG